VDPPSGSSCSRFSESLRTLFSLTEFRFKFLWFDRQKAVSILENVLIGVVGDYFLSLLESRGMPRLAALICNLKGMKSARELLESLAGFRSGLWFNQAQ
jgi:hypothetical protein